jgi:hypothetical protein
VVLAQLGERQALCVQPGDELDRLADLRAGVFLGARACPLRAACLGQPVGDLPGREGADVASVRALRQPVERRRQPAREAGGRLVPPLEGAVLDQRRAQEGDRAGVALGARERVEPGVGELDIAGDDRADVREPRGLHPAQRRRRIGGARQRLEVGRQPRRARRCGGRAQLVDAVDEQARRAEPPPDLVLRAAARADRKLVDARAIGAERPGASGPGRRAARLAAAGAARLGGETAVVAAVADRAVG